MRVLLTGGAGFIGSHVTQRLLADGHEVLSLDNFDPAYPRAYKERNLIPVRSESGFRFVEVDIRDRGRVRDLFEDFSPEALVHLAAKTGVRSSLADAPAYLDVNLGGTLVPSRRRGTSGPEKSSSPRRRRSTAPTRSSPSRRATASTVPCPCTP